MSRPCESCAFAVLLLGCGVLLLAISFAAYIIRHP